MIKFYIQVFGCQMSKSDAERLAAFLENLGFVATAKENEADILIINACSVRQSAMDRVHGLVRKWRRWQEKNKKIIIILTGCVLPADKKIFEAKFDLVVGVGEFRKLHEFLDRKLDHQKNRKTEKQKDKKGKNLFSGLATPKAERMFSCFLKRGEKKYEDYLQVVPHYHNKFSALVPIMTGCNNFCSYCAVPYVRGRERSRKVVEVLVEIKKLAQQGYLEIILLGQNVNSYLPKDKKIFSRRNPFKHPFAALLWEINQIKGLERIFFTAPHPKDMADEVIKALALPKMVNYLHLPVQAGSDKILKRMNRHYRASDYLKLVKKIKKQKPDIALGTDIIVGFPGETKKDFAATVALYRKVEFDIAYTARYSPRAGTVAAKLSDNISVREKDRRWWVLQRLMEKIALEKNQKYRSQIVSVLVDKYKDGRCEGNSREMKRVEFQGSKELVGKVVQIKINKALTWILQGMIN